MMGGVMGGVTLPLPEQPECISVDVNGLSDITNQSHLTKVREGEREIEREKEFAMYDKDYFSPFVCMCIGCDWVWR